MSAAERYARRLWVRVRVVLLAPLILLSGIIIGCIIGFLSILEAVDDATKE